MLALGSVGCYQHWFCVDITELQNLFYTDWLYSALVLAFWWRKRRELVCYIDYLLLMRSKIARNASSSIDGTDLALSLLHLEHVFLLIFKIVDKTLQWRMQEWNFYQMLGFQLAIFTFAYFLHLWTSHASRTTARLRSVNLRGMRGRWATFTDQRGKGRKLLIMRLTLKTQDNE